MIHPVFEALLIIFFFLCVYISIFINTIEITMKIRCRKNWGCQNDHCWYRPYCELTSLSDKEKAELREYLDRLKLDD